MGRLLDDGFNQGTIPIGRLGGTRFSLSYLVFISAAVLFAVVLASSKQNGNEGLPRAAALGAALWVSGWVIQLITHVGVTRLLDLPLRHVSIGLLGVEGSPRNWPASRTLMTTLATIASLLVLGSFYRLVEGGFQMPVLSRAPTEVWATPSIGFEAEDSIWRTGAWLCWVQAICQMYPLPRALGRYAFASFAALCGYRLPAVSQVLIFRRSLLLIALVTVCLGLYLMNQTVDEISWPKWPLVLLLSVLLWTSTRNVDIPLIIEGFAGPHEPRQGVVATLREKVRGYRGRQRLKQAFERERGEAVDAARLDEILNRLHEHGQESLSEEDRQILARVSENLRRERE